MRTLTAQFFIEAVKQEKKEKLEFVPQYSEYDSRISPNNITYEEKKNWCDQSYITKRDPNRIKLDSIFRGKLTKEDIRGWIVLRCLLKEHVTYSSSNTSLCENSNLITSVIYRFNEKPEDRFELQAYVKISFWSILMKVESLGLIILLWLISLAVVVGGYLYIRRSEPLKTNETTKSSKSIKPVKPLRKPKRKVKRPIIPQYQIDSEWIQLSDNLLFNKRLGVLKCGDVTTTLFGNGLKLFCMFLNAPNNSLTYNDISVRLLQRSSVGFSKSDQSAVFSTMKRFRDDLAAIPYIETELLRRMGYRMYILTEQELAELLLIEKEQEEQERMEHELAEQELAEQDPESQEAAGEVAAEQKKKGQVPDELKTLEPPGPEKPE